MKNYTTYTEPQKWEHGMLQRVGNRLRFSRPIESYYVPQGFRFKPKTFEFMTFCLVREYWEVEVEGWSNGTQ